MRKDKTYISAELSRELSLFHITMMGLGMMIGAGVFIDIGNAIYFAGPGGVLLTFAMGFLFTIVLGIQLTISISQYPSIILQGYRDP